METKNDKLLIQFKEDIQKKYGQKVQYPRDCNNLLLHIQAKTNRDVSITTLKRFFGIIHSKFAPAKYTLDTLAIYLNYEKWQDYIHHAEKQANSTLHPETWVLLKKQTREITDASLRSLKTKIRSDLAKIPFRKFAEEKFDIFLHSSKVATAFIAPDGYGKSTIVTQLVNKFFAGENARYPDDIICLIDAGLLFNLIAQNPKVAKLYNLLDYDPRKSVSSIFRTNSQSIMGRFVLIIDDLDALYADAQRSDFFLDNLVKMVSSNERNEWFKLVITCSPIIWKRFSFILQKNSIYKSLWFDVNFEGALKEMINVPLLSSDEIESALTFHSPRLTLDEVSYYEPGIISVINNPYLLYLFISSYKPDKIINEAELLYEFVQKRIFGTSFSDENYRIINTFFRLCDNGKNGAIVNKEDLRQYIENNLAYNELILNGILFEYTVLNSYLSINTYVKFSNAVFFEFYLANKLIKENKLNLNLIKQIITDYKSDPQLQHNLFKFVLKISFLNDNVQFLENIISELSLDDNESHTLFLNSNYSTLANLIGIELRKRNKLSATLFPAFGQSLASQTQYFESIFDFDSLALYSGANLDYWLHSEQSSCTVIYVHFLKFMQYFLTGDYEKCQKEYLIFQKMEQPLLKNTLCMGFYFAPQIIFQSVIKKRLHADLLKKIHLVSNKLLKEGNNSLYPNYEFVLIYAFNYAKIDLEIINIADCIFNKYDLTDSKSSCLYQLILAIYARALLKTGKIQQGVELFNKTELEGIPVNMRNYIKIRYDLIKVEFLIHEGDLKKAQETLEGIKGISNLLKFKYFYNNALELETQIREKSKALNSSLTN